MEISNLNLLQITAKKVYHEPEKETEDALVNDTVAAVNTCNNSLTGDELTISGQTVGLFRDISDVKLNAMYCAGDVVTMRDAGNVTEGEGVAGAEGATGTGGATGTDETAGAGGILAGATKGDSDVIKATLYNYFHPKINFINTGYSFNNTDELFAWFEAQGIKGAKTDKKITKADLTQLIHKNEANEDANADFLGILNRAFSEKGAKDTITYKEINNLLIKAAGTDAKVDVGEFKSKVEQYAAKVQKEYEKCGNNQAKLEFIINKTYEYLDAAKLDLQKAALERLKNEKDTYYPEDTPHVGQIVFANFEGNDAALSGSGVVTYGAYAFKGAGWTDADGKTINSYTSTSEPGRPYATTLWAGDDDTVDESGKKADFGLTLMVQFLEPKYGYKWYEIVDTLVHELTHATAYCFFDVKKSEDGTLIGILPSIKGLEYMRDNGIITKDEYDKFVGCISGGTLSDGDLSRLQYLLSVMSDEYMAYQADADYLDSIGADILDADSKHLATNVNGALEKEAITEHINTLYNNGNLGKQDADGNYTGLFVAKPYWWTA